MAKKSKNTKYICTDVEQLRAAFNTISVFRTEDTRFMAQALLFLCEKDLKAGQLPSQSTEEFEAAVNIASAVGNETDLNDGGYFEAGFIAAKTKIVDALIAARDSAQRNPSALRGGSESSST